MKMNKLYQFFSALFIFLFFTSKVSSQNNLAPGDIAIVSYQSDFDQTNTFDPAVAEFEDRFSIAVLRPGGLAAGTIIYFTDRGWDGPNTTWLDNVTVGHEAVIKWVVPAGGVAQGTEVYFIATYHDELGAGNEIYTWGAYSNEAGTTPLGVVTTETTLPLDGMGFTVAGDNLLVYQTGPTAGPAGIYSATPIRFVTGLLANIVANSTTYPGWDATPATLNESSLPPGLTNGTSAFVMSPGPLPNATVNGTTEPDNGKYNCTNSNGVACTVLALSAFIYTTTNWDYNNTQYGIGLTSNHCTYAVVPPITITAPTVTQPTCATPTGTIVVNATGTGTLEYQLNAGSFQTSNTFSGLAPGSYNIHVRSQSAPACVTDYASNPVVINAVPACPALTINNVTLNEGNAGPTTFTLTVSLSSPAGASGVTFDIATADGTAQDDNPATEDNDYVQKTLTSQTILAGSSSYTFDVIVNGDVAVEANETFFVNVTNVTGAIVSDGQGQGNITNDDAQPTISINNVTIAEGNAGTTAFVFTAMLSNPSAQTVTVNFSTNNGSATVSDNDYGSIAGTITFPPGTTTQTITVLVNGDVNVEPDEFFVVDLSGATNGTIADSQGQGNITNDDAQPTISINNVTMAEGNAGTTAFVFTVTLSNPSAQTVTVNFNTNNGSATVADNDYESSAGTITFPPGTTTQTITVLVNGDVKFEPDEFFVFDLSGATNGTIADFQGQGNITNDDAQPTISINNVTMAEGNSGTTAFVFTITLSNPSAQAVTVNFNTNNGSATLADNDYESTAGTVTFSPNTTTQTITVLVNGDVNIEPDEFFVVDLSGATNGTIADSQGQGNITNDDAAPTPNLTINDVSLNEGNAGPTTFTFTVSLSTPAGVGGVTFDIATADGTAQDDNPATEDNDYVQKILTGQTIPTGFSTYTFDVTVNGDVTVEANETFFVNVTNVSGANVTDGQGLGTITNDDNNACEINSLILSNFSTCNNNGTTSDPSDDFYTADLTVNFVNPPATGTLRIEPGNPNVLDVVEIAVGSLIGNTHTFTSVRLRTTGAVFAVEVEFSANNACVRTIMAPPVSSCSSSPAPTTTVLTSAPNPSCFGSTVTFTATVTSGGNSVITGSVTFSEGSTILAPNIPVNASGQAVFSTSSLTAGSHTITASFNGTANFAPSAGSITQVVNQPPTINAPTVTQPNCQTPTGTIVVNATGSGTLEYRLNSGSWQTSNTFSGLAPGNYNISVRLQSNPGCAASYSGNPVVLNPATGCCVPPTINAPTVTQPTCAIPTGKIIVNATGSGTLEYRLNSGSWQLSNTFSGLASGSYNISVRLKYNTSCVASYIGNPVVLNPATGCCAPTINAPTVTQPTCAVSTGKIVVNATGSGILEYRLNSGSWQISNTFSGLAPGSYNISVRLKYNTSCVASYSGNPVVLKAATGCCAPTVNAPTVTQPTCAVSTGKIIVNATGSGTLEYRLNSGSWQLSNTFSGLAPGSYNISVRLKYNTSCAAIYSGNPVVLKAASGCCAPTINAPTVTQPTCAVSTGKIIVNATGSGMLEYKLNSGSWQISNTFSGLAPGSYNISVRLKYNTSCVANYSGNPVVLNTATSCGPVDPNKCYKIVNRNSGKALSIEYCSTSDNKEAEQQASSSCMIWKFVQVQTGYYKIINVYSGKSLEVKYGSLSDYANVVQGSYSGQSYEKWSLAASGAYFVIKAKHSGKAMSIKNASTLNGADVVQKGTGSNSNEQWSIVEITCPNTTQTRGLITKGQPENSLEEKLSVSATPNPGTSFFNLTFRSNDKTTPVTVRILDVNGELISVRQKLQVSSTIRIAADKWAGGIYFAEVTQGDQRKTVKMVKVN